MYGLALGARIAHRSAAIACTRQIHANGAAEAGAAMHVGSHSDSHADVRRAGGGCTRKPKILGIFLRIGRQTEVHIPSELRVLLRLSQVVL